MERFGDIPRSRGLFIQQDSIPSTGGAGGIEVERRPLPTTVDEAWVNYRDVMIMVSNIPDESFFFPLKQDLLEELGLSSLQVNDGRETLGAMHGIEIPPEPDRTKWPKTLEDMFRKYVSYTPAQADLEAHPDHELFSREA